MQNRHYYMTKQLLELMWVDDWFDYCHIVILCTSFLQLTMVWNFLLIAVKPIIPAKNIAIYTN